MKKIQIVKAVTNLIVGVGTAKIVSTIISNNVQPETITDKVTVKTSSFVLGAMVADISSRYTNAKIDEIAAWIDENFPKTTPSE